jgi:hypothetical protein
VLFCDKNASADLACETELKSGLPFVGPIIGKRTTSIWSQQKCSVFCERRGDRKAVRIGCDHWERPAPTEPKPPVKKPPVKKSGPGTLLSMFLGSSWQGSAIVSSFVPAEYNPDSADEKEPDEIISDSARWRLLEGEAGIEQGMLMVATGEAEARSFCTGDTIRLVGPNVLSLPTCQTDVSGRWQGAYARPLSKGTREAVTVSLNLRKESGSLRGELITSDGTFNIVEGSKYDAQYGGSRINLQAERTVAGTKETIKLNGSLTKGEIVFGGNEQLAGGAWTYGLSGFVRRLYIADNALPPAILNQPYSSTLMASSPGDQAITFRLATPAIIQPAQITWNTNAKDLRGRNGERFTYGCPPANPSINPVVYGTDIYTDDSSICTAAVHAGLITRQAGSVVTIQIRPDAGSYTASTRNGVSSKSYGAYKGSYSFVRVESNSGERGRLPKGLSFDSRSGTFSGTPTELGSFDISVVADDGAGNVFEQPLTITVNKLVVTNRLLPDGFVGQPYAATLKVAGGQAPYRFSGSPPKGLQLDPITGEVSGKPSSPVSYASFEVTIRDSQNNSESQKVSMSVRGATILNSHFLPDAKVGVPYRTQFQIVGSLAPINWVFGRVDASSIGLALNERTGELSGTPMKAGNFFIEVRAEVGSSVPTRNFALTIK